MIYPFLIKKENKSENQNVWKEGEEETAWRLGAFCKSIQQRKDPMHLGYL